MRSRSPGLWLLERERGFRTPLYGSRVELRRSNARCAERLRRQGQRAQPGCEVRGAGFAGHCRRGMRPVRELSELQSAYERCRSEALQAFGNGDVYVEKLFPKARHIEIQVIGDGSGAVTHLWERECSLQRQRQKLVEIAPALDLSTSLRDRLLDAALRMARMVRLRNIATFEFLVAH